MLLKFFVQIETGHAQGLVKAYLNNFQPYIHHINLCNALQSCSELSVIQHSSYMKVQQKAQQKKLKA